MTAGRDDGATVVTYFFYMENTLICNTYCAPPRTRIKAQSKSLKEAERRIGQTKAANQQCREGDRVSGTRRRGFSAGADNHIRNSSTEALMSTDSTHDMARGVSFEAVVAEAVETGTGGLAGGDDRNVNKEVCRVLSCLLHFRVLRGQHGCLRAEKASNQ